MGLKEQRGDKGRAGSWALSLLSDPFNLDVLQELATGPKSLADLEKDLGSPPATTLRERLRVLTEIGVLKRDRARGFPGPVTLELTAPGCALLPVAEMLRDWLSLAPECSTAPYRPAVKDAIRALVGGWQTNIVRAISPRPLSLTELDRALVGLDYPSLQRRLAAMRRVGLVKATQSRSRVTPYAATIWLRRAAALIAAAAHWEQLYQCDRASPITRPDVEAAFLLSVPLLELPTELSGSCCLMVELANGESSQRSAGVSIEVEDGRIVSCVSRLRADTDAWATGPSIAWFWAAVDHDQIEIEIGGETDVALKILDGLRRSAASPL